VLRLDRGGDVTMQPAAARRADRRVEDLAQPVVREVVAPPVLADDLAHPQLVESGDDVVLGRAGGPGEQRRLERAADGRANLREVARACRQSRETRGDHRLDRRRERAVAVVEALGPGELDGEQRAALGLRPHSLGGGRVDRAAGDLAREPERLVEREPPEADLRGAVLARQTRQQRREGGMRGDVLVAHGARDHECRRACRRDEIAEELERVVVAPLDVVEHEEQR
jgi:hypothetical protein